MESGKINVVIADDHKLFRKGICALLSDFDYVNEIHEAGNGIELLSLLASLDKLPHVILLDINMPEMDGVEAQLRIKEIYPEIKIIILTMEDDEHFILHLINEGVNGYLLKNADPDEMEVALKKVVQTDFYFSDDILDMVMKSMIKKEKSRFSVQHEISEREFQVLELICHEKTASEIADLLNLSIRTIEGHRKKLLEKTGTKNTAGLVFFAVKNNLIST